MATNVYLGGCFDSPFAQRLGPSLASVYGNESSAAAAQIGPDKYLTALGAAVVTSL